MQPTRAALPIAVSLVAATLLTTTALPAQSTGAYTAAQAADGAAIFATKCSMCHGVQLQGKVGPALAGPAFIASYSGQTADDVRDFISTAMPLTAPGSLKPAEVLAVLAYILQRNKYAAGAAPLTDASSKTVTIATQPN
jgi:mono/diheme cytochrome c family protein